MLVRVSYTTAGVNKEEELENSLNDRLPRFQASTFLNNLHNAIGSIMKAHYDPKRLSSMPLNLLRIQIFDSPYSTSSSLSGFISKAVIDAFLIIYIAFLDASPFIYISHAKTPGESSPGDGKILRKIVIDALPKAISQSRQRYTLKPSSLSARSHAALLVARGPGREMPHWEAGQSS